jgi:hypothetical protein
MGTDDDLRYDGHLRKRPPGANPTVQEIYMLLAEHPAGMTRDEIWAAMRDGWLNTDAYRAYSNRIEQQREPSADPAHRRTGGRASADYGTDLFKERAQKWWISKTLASMARKGTARHDGDRWSAARPPRIRNPKADPRRYVPLDPAAQRASDAAATRAHVVREQVKARVRADLHAPRATRARLLETLELVDAYLSGRLS